jgi:integrase
MGKRYEKTSTVSQKEADRKAYKLETELKNGLIGISSNMRVKAWSLEWLETYKKPILANKQFKDYKRQIDKDILPAIGGLKLCEVRDIHLQKILNTKKGFSETRIKMLYLAIHGLFKQARISKLIPFDPSEDLTLPASTKGTHRSISNFERTHFLKVAERHRAGLMFKTMLYCGLRTGEVTALSWKDIDFEGHFINVVAAMESGKEDTLKAPKTEAGVRSVPIPDEIYYDLFERRGDPFLPVFTRSVNGIRLNESSRNAAWRSFKNDMDISMGAKFEKRKAKDGKMRKTKTLSVVAKDFVPYCLRHTYCTDLQKKGVSLKMASYLMGHANISITANIYTHVTEEAINEVAELLGVTSGVSAKNQGLETA